MNRLKNNLNPCIVPRWVIQMPATMVRHRSECCDLGVRIGILGVAGFILCNIYVYVYIYKKHKIYVYIIYIYLYMYINEVYILKKYIYI